MTFESEGLLIVAIYTWLPPASYVVFSDNSGFKVAFKFSRELYITEFSFETGYKFSVFENFELFNV